MRYTSEWFTCTVSLRQGVLTVVDEQDVAGTVVQSTILDPAWIGKMMHRSSLPRFPFAHWSRVQPDMHEAKAKASGATGVLNYYRSAAHIEVSSDGGEARFRLRPPSWDGMESLDFPGLSSHRPYLEKYLEFTFTEAVENPKAERRLLIAAWHDPEMLGQAVLNIFGMAGPPFIKGVDSIFDSPPPKRRVTPHKVAAAGNLDELPKANRGRVVDPLDSEGTTPLMLAASNGHTAVVQRLVGLGAEVNLQDARGRSALHHAGESGRAETLSALLAAGAETATVDEAGRTPLHLAVAGGHTPVVERLLAAGADPNATDVVFQSTPLHLAARGNHAHVVTVLADAGADVNADNEHGRTPLHVAVAYGFAKTGWALITAGADVNRRDQDRETPLHRAVFYQHLDCIALLAERGADVNVADAAGNTPLHVAGSMNREKAAQVLMGTGADVERRNAEGLTALDLAIVNAHYEGRIDSSYCEHNAEVADVLVKGGASTDSGRLPVGDRHVLWPHFTPQDVLFPYGDIDNSLLHELPEAWRDAVRNTSWAPGPPVSKVVSMSGALLHDAVRKNLPGLVWKLLDAGVSPMTAVRYFTPLHQAAMEGNVAVAALLLEGGADLEMPGYNSRDQLYDLGGVGRYHNSQETPLDSAIRFGQHEMVRFLLERGAVPPATRTDVQEGRFEVRPNHLGKVRDALALHPLRGCPKEKQQAVIEVFEEFGLPI